MTYHMLGLFCSPEKQNLDTRCWPKSRCTEVHRALVTAATTLGDVEVTVGGLCSMEHHRAGREWSSPET